VNPFFLDPEQGEFRQLLAFDREVLGLSRALEESPLFRKCAAAENTFECNRFHPDEEDVLFPLGRISLGEASLILDSVSEKREAHLVRALESVSGGVWEWDERRVFGWEDALARPQALAFASSPWTRDTVAAFFLRAEWAFVPRTDLKQSAPYQFAGTAHGRAKLEAILPPAMAGVRERFPSFPDWDFFRLLDGIAMERTAREESPAPAKSRPR
jgi:hypothetical protein